MIFVFKEICFKDIRFNENLQLWEDPELHIRAILTGFSFKVNKNPKPDCYYRNDRDGKKELLNC